MGRYHLSLKFDTLSTRTTAFAAKRHSVSPKSFKCNIFNHVLNPKSEIARKKKNQNKISHPPLGVFRHDAPAYPPPPPSGRDEIHTQGHHRTVGWLYQVCCIMDVCYIKPQSKDYTPSLGRQRINYNRPPFWPHLVAFLAPPAERPRSFSNAESSVVVSFSLKIFISQTLRHCLITFFLLWHGALLGMYQCTVKMWIWLNHPKGQF